SSTWTSDEGNFSRRTRSRWTEEVVSQANEDGSAFKITRDSCGWPLRSLEGFRIWRNTLSPVRQYVSVVRVQGLSLPLQPLWPGFAINTVFYAAVLWGLFAGPFALRRTIRRRRGQCAACGYPVGASKVCTECGAQLPSPSR